MKYRHRRAALRDLLSRADAAKSIDDQVDRILTALDIRPEEPEDALHQIQFTDDGWMIMHPLEERMDGSIWDCLMTWSADDDGARGRFYLHDDGTVGDRVPTGAPGSSAIRWQR